MKVYKLILYMSSEYVYINVYTYSHARYPLRHVLTNGPDGRYNLSVLSANQDGVKPFNHKAAFLRIFSWSYPVRMSMRPPDMRT